MSAVPGLSTLPAFAPSASDLWALGGWACVVAAAVATVGLRGRAAAAPGGEPDTGRRLALAAVAVALLLTAVLPMAARLDHGLTWAAVLRGHVGDPGAVLVVAALWRLAGRLAGTGGPRSPDAARRADADRRLLLGLAAVAGWLLIVTQLGTDRIDPYRLGYGAPEVVAGVAVAAGAAAWWGHARTATALAAGLAAWGLGLTESSNLWDALFDPWVTVAATAWWSAWGWRRWRVGVQPPAPT